jgi:hypothetical protein
MDRPEQSDPAEVVMTGVTVEPGNARNSEAPLTRTGPLFLPQGCRSIITNGVLGTCANAN